MKNNKKIVFTEKEFITLKNICNKLKELNAKTQTIYSLGVVYSFMFDNMEKKMIEKNKKAFEKFNQNY